MIKSLQAVPLQLGVGKILYRSQIPIRQKAGQGNQDGTDGATALGKEVRLLVDKLIKKVILDTNKSLQNGYVLAGNL